MNQDKRTSLQPDTQNNVEKCLVIQAGEFANFTGRPEAWPAELPLEGVVLLADLNGTEVGKGVHVSQCHVGNSNTIESMHTITECTHFLAYPAT